jgi:hypothetical protein
MTISREKLLLRQIERVKVKLAALGDLRPGSLSTQYNVCGTPGCRCKATPPEKHGPYYQVSFTRKGKSSYPTSAWPTSTPDSSRELGTVQLFIDSDLREEPQMNAAPKPETAPDEFVDNEPSDEIVNDSLGAVDQADTTDTDPNDDPETVAESDPSSGIED